MNPRQLILRLAIPCVIAFFALPAAGQDTLLFHAWARVALPYFANELRLDSDYAYVWQGEYGRGMNVVDIRDPALPTLAGSFLLPDTAYDLEWDAVHAYLAAGTSVIILDRSDPLDWTEVARLPMEAWGISRYGSYLYVEDPDTGITVVDVSVPQSPQTVGFMDLDLGDPPYIYGDCLYVVYGWIDVQILRYDLADPTRPVVVDSTALPRDFGWMGFTFEGRRALINDWESPVAGILSIAPDGRLTLEGTFPAWTFRTAGALAGNYAFLLSAVGGLTAHDISDPEAVRTVGGLPRTAVLAGTVAARGSNLFLSEGDTLTTCEWTVMSTAPEPGLAPLPSAISLSAYPNPFNSVTTLSYTLPRAEEICVELFDVTGRLVKELKRGRVEAGTHAVRVEMNGFASGLYFARLQAGTTTQTQKLLLIR